MENVDQVRSAVLALDDMKFAQIHANQIQVKFSDSESLTIILHVQVRNIEEHRSAILGRIVQDNILQGHPGGKEAELELANLGIKACFTADPFFHQVASDVVLQQHQADAKHNGQHQQAECPTKDELDHARFVSVL